MKKLLAACVVSICLFSQNVFSKNLVNYDLIGKKVVFIKPVTDLFVSPSGSYMNEKERKKAFSGYSNGSCVRCAQALFNEIGTVVAQKGDEIQVKMPNFFFTLAHDESQKKRSAFWTFKDNVVPLDDVGDSIKNFIPNPVSYDNRQSVIMKNIVVLTMPWKSPKTGVTYSVGTRFVRAKEAGSNNNGYAVYLLNMKKMRIAKDVIPRDKSFISFDLKYKNRRNLCAKLVQHWCKQMGTIPYVWGGSSFTMPLKSEKFALKKDQQKKLYWGRDVSETPLNGFDCSGIILRAAQICGIPYFYKTTGTFSRAMRQLRHGDKVKKGDLIWMPGHVAMVSDVKKNTLIESGGYGSGYGKLHEIALKDYFKGITTYDDLLKASSKNKVLNRFKKDGSLKTATQVKLFALAVN